MAKLQTVTGEISTDELGVTLMHEHVMISHWFMRLNFANWPNEDAFVDYAKRMIGRAKQRGLKTIVDATPIDLNRDIRLIQQVAEAAEIQVVACTGFYSAGGRVLEDKSEAFLTALLVGEIEKGIAGTGMRAGAVKCASDDEVTPENKKLLRVCAAASNATGVPLITHTTPRSAAAQQRYLLEECGVPPGRLLLGHVGDIDDLDAVQALLAPGSFIGLDRFGLDFWLPKENRLANLLALCGRGYRDQLMLSHDCSIFIDFTDDMEDVGNPWEQLFQPRDLENHRFQFSYLFDEIFPAALERGLARQDIERMMVDNPRRIFGG